MHDGGERARGGRLVVDFGGIGVDGVDLHGHGQLVQIAVEEHAAAGSDFKGALLLLIGALDEFLVAEYLEPEQAAGDQACPDQERRRSARSASPRGVARGTFSSVGLKGGCLHGVLIREFAMRSGSKPALILRLYAEVETPASLRHSSHDRTGNYDAVAIHGLIVSSEREASGAGAALPAQLRAPTHLNERRDEPPVPAPVGQSKLAGH